jgi:hypothetical protein
VRSKDDHCVYSKEEGDHLIYVSLYGVDMFPVRNNMDEKKEVNMQLSSKLDMKYFIVVNLIMEMEIKRDWEVIKLWLN